MTAATRAAVFTNSVSVDAFVRATAATMNYGGAGALSVSGTNTANGAFALVSNTEGFLNTAVGDRALQSNTTGKHNTAAGADTLLFNTTADDNTAIGDSALLSNTIGGANTAIGFQALLENTEGADNTATGHNARYWARATAGLDFSEADRVPPAKFNRIVWRGIKGQRPYPARRGRQVAVNDRDD